MIHLRLSCAESHAFSSTHNTRIERLWVEVGRNFCRNWRAFFGRLDSQFGLDCSNPSHIWLLQTLFLNDINTDCDSFIREWNAHPISGHDTNDMSPQVCSQIIHLCAQLILTQDLRFLRQTQLGIYNDDCEGIHPDTIQEFYGTTQNRIERQTGQTGAGNPPEELDNNCTEISLINNVVQGQDSNVRHDSIPTADHETPPMSPENLTLLSDCLATLQNQNQDNLLRLVNGGPFVWDPMEVMRVGRRRQQELVISLADTTWERRALLWLAAVRVFDSIL